MTHGTRLGRRLATFCVWLAAGAAGSGMVGAVAQGVFTTPATAHVGAAATTTSHAAAAMTHTAPAAEGQQARLAIAPCMGNGGPTCCGGPLGGTDSSCGQPLVDDPSGANRFQINDCATATYVAVGTVCATTHDPLGIAVAPTGAANGGELAVSVIGPANACGGPESVAISVTGPVKTCKGTVPVPGAHTANVSFNGG